MSKTGFKVRKLRIRQRWAQKKHKKSHAKRIVSEKKINPNEWIPYYPVHMMPYTRPKRCPVIQLIEDADKNVTVHYVGKDLKNYKRYGVMASFAVEESNRFVFS